MNTIRRLGLVQRRGNGLMTRLLSSADKVIEVGSDSAFEKIAQANVKRILYFTATWCPPCRAIAPVFKSLSSQHPAIAFVKIDVDVNPATAQTFNIRSVPTFMYFSGEKKLTEHSGASEPTLKTNIALLESS